MKKHALVVDDSRTAAAALSEMLRLLDFEVIASINPTDALKKLSEHNFDVVFMDVNMPGVTGLEVTSFMRREPGLSQVPVIVVSSESQPEQVKDALKAGALAFITKPATFESLEEALKKLGAEKH